MRQKWIFVPKKPKQQKTKPIAKKYGQPKLPPTSIVKVTYKFKQRKIQCSPSDSLQNFRSKLSSLYDTCKFIKLSHSVFLMSLKNLKRLMLKNPNTTITGPQTLACVTLAIKFDQEIENSVQFIVSKTKVLKSEVLGAEYFVFETLDFRLPIFDTFQHDLNLLVQRWNSFVLKNHSSKSNHFLINRDESENSQKFRNYINLIIVTDQVLVLMTEESGQNYQKCMSLALYFVIVHSASLVFPKMNFFSVLHLFWAESENYRKELYSVALKSLIKLECGTKLQLVSLVQYSKIKEFDEITHHIL